MHTKRKTVLQNLTGAASVLPTFTALSATFEVLPPIGPKEEEVTAAIVGYGAEGEILTDAALRIPGVEVSTNSSWERMVR